MTDDKYVCVYAYLLASVSNFQVYFYTVCKMNLIYIAENFLNHFLIYSLLSSIKKDFYFLLAISRESIVLG